MNKITIILAFIFAGYIVVILMQKVIFMEPVIRQDLNSSQHMYGMFKPIKVRSLEVFIPTKI